MRVLVVGTGAIGGLYAGKLAQSGAEVALICRSDYEIVKKNGIFVKSQAKGFGGDFKFKPKEVLRNAADYNQKADFILVTTKVLPEISVVDLIKPALHPQASIILLQNGIHIEKPVAKAFPNHHLISALAFVCVSRTSPGIINHEDYGRLVIGDYPNGISEKTLELLEMFKKSGVPCEASENIQAERWKKLVWNAPFNPMSVLCNGADTKKILENPHSKALAINVMREVCILAKADGFELPEGVIEKNIDATEKMKPYKTSMLLDFESKRKMETEAILGNALRFAQNKSIAVPYISTLYALLSNY